jgi:hypothetical protein
MASFVVKKLFYAYAYDYCAKLLIASPYSYALNAAITGWCFIVVTEL